MTPIDGKLKITELSAGDAADPAGDPPAHAAAPYAYIHLSICSS